MGGMYKHMIRLFGRGPTDQPVSTGPTAVDIFLQVTGTVSELPQFHIIRPIYELIAMTVKTLFTVIASP